MEDLELKGSKRKIRTEVEGSVVYMYKLQIQNENIAIFRENLI
jgi:hypothetical protein